MNNKPKGGKMIEKKLIKKKGAGKKNKAFQEIVLHEEWPKTESLLRSEEQRGILLDPDRELTAKPNFVELTGKNVARSSREEAWWQPAVAIFARLSGWLLAPLIIGVTLGKWLDRKYDSAPWLFLVTIGIAFMISMFGLIKNALEEFKKIDNALKNNNVKDNFRKNK